MPALLEVNNLHKRYGKLHAVRGATFEVETGTCFGLLGPNGAGKTTTIEIIEKIIEEDSGEILFKGRRRGPDFLERLGVQFQETSLPNLLRVRETIEFFASLYKESRSVDELIEMCQIEEFEDQYNNKISGGQKQRLLLAISLCHNPELVLLDEPTTGLDPQARRHLWELVKTIKKQGKTIILTTHYMEEASELCDQIGIMDHGQIIAMGSPKDLLAENFRTVVLQIPIEHLSEQDAKAWLGEESSVFRSENFVEVHSKDLPESLKRLFDKNVDLHGLNVRQSNLEDLFLKLTGKELRK